MAETAAEAAARLAAFDATCATIGPALSTTFEGQQMTWASLEDRMAYRASLVARVAAASGATTTRYASMSKGI